MEKVFSKTNPPTYYECGICGALHAAEWTGDCRQDSARLEIEEIESHHSGKWLEVSMESLDND